MDQFPEVCATSRDEVVATEVHTNRAVPGARAEVTEEVVPGEAAATAATNSESSTKKKVRGKKKSEQQSRLSSNAQKRYRKEKFEKCLASSPPGELSRRQLDDTMPVSY